MLTDTLNPIGSRFTVGRYLPHMEKTLGFKIEAAKLAKIDALAQTRGGRGPFMRQLVDAVLRQSGAAIEAAPVADREAAGEHRLYLRPTETERSEEHTSELQSLMRISYAVFCLQKKKKQ